MMYLRILRPTHWTKNVFVFAALIFGQKLLDPRAVAQALAGFVCFCLASSSMYIINDILDQRSDRLHPEKRKRPIASGDISIRSAMWIALFSGIIALIGAFFLTHHFALVVLIYLILMVFYSLIFKHVMILDCVVIATGFCLRAVAGAVVISVLISPWLIVCTFALCLFLAFSKRRSEIALLRDESEAFRQTLAGYTPELLVHMLNVTSGLAVVCFLLYAMDDWTYKLFGSNHLVYTTPLVLYCIFRFSALMQQGIYLEPVQLMLHDRPFQIGFVLWVISCVGIIYAGKSGIVPSMS